MEFSSGRRSLRCWVLVAWCVATVPVVAAQVADPVVPEPRDIDYPGVVELRVDATDLDRRIVRVHQTLPVGAPGPLTLLYPRWLPGNHSTTGPIEMLAGLQVRTDAGTRLPWRRDAIMTHAFHVDVPPDTAQLELEFDFLTPVSAEQGRVVITRDLLGLQWEKALLYPAGHYASRIPYAASVRLPAGWAYATSLRGGVREGDVVRFGTTSLERLVDSPLWAGAHHREIDVGADPRRPVRLQVFADRPAELVTTAEQVDAHRRLVSETLALFGTRHYREYDFLLAISQQFGRIGLEHLESSENAVVPGYFTDPNGVNAPRRDLLPHEFVHSWNGKYRRPADLWTPSYEVPMRTSLLWVYEGLTKYWGMVIAARSGLWSQEFTRAALAHHAAANELSRPGRAWRNLQDTTHQPVILYRGSQPYASWQRGADYYTEGALLWLDVDTRIREATRGGRSLDDFARAFFGREDGRMETSTYTYADVVAALTAIAPVEWDGWLRERLEGHGPGAPLQGLERGGWRLVYGDTPSEFTRLTDAGLELDSFLYSIGLSVQRTGRIAEVTWDGPAFDAGLAPGMQLIAVNGRAYTSAVLREAITNAKSDAAAPLELLVRRGDLYQTVALDYRDGLRYPRLERLEGADDRLGAVLKPRGNSGSRPARR
jgi:predicted metalloprotease with PDZ domain